MNRDIASTVACAVLVVTVLRASAQEVEVPPQRENFFEAFAGDLAVLEACSERSPALAQRYETWVAGLPAEISGWVPAAHRLSTFQPWKIEVKRRMDRLPEADVLRDCAHEFDQEQRRTK